ncbi:hypothetical protein ILYODFUR_019563, partial [Ilyodon furcidens]
FENHQPQQQLKITKFKSARGMNAEKNSTNQKKKSSNTNEEESTGIVCTTMVLPSAFLSPSSGSDT